MISGLILAYILVGEVIACVITLDGVIYEHRQLMLESDSRWAAAVAWVMLVIFWPSVVTSKF